jgi:hypothetical protein
MDIKEEQAAEIDAAHVAWVAAWEAAWAAADHAWHQERLKSGGDKIIRASGRAAWTAAMVAAMPPPQMAAQNAETSLAWETAWEKALIAAKVSLTPRRDAENLVGRDDIGIEERISRGKEAGSDVWMAAREGKPNKGLR